MLREYIAEAMGMMPDAMVGHGYGHTGPSKFHGKSWQAGGDYPYSVPPSDDDDEDVEIDDETLDGVARKTNRNYMSPDPIKQRVGDRLAFCTGATKLGEAGLPTDKSDFTYQRIFTTRPGSSRNAVGSAYGWSHAPPPVDPYEENDDWIFNLEDLFDDEDDI